MKVEPSSGAFIDEAFGAGLLTDAAVYGFGDVPPCGAAVDTLHQLAVIHPASQIHLSWKSAREGKHHWVVRASERSEEPSVS